ncbi:MAG TPA: PEP-CTERM sorting domain-containing protein [Phycisphaerae bacterium]|nr:PEP-CTERM sorting domain-containing protein [Phycisphaerae bacterium]
MKMFNMRSGRRLGVVLSGVVASCFAISPASAGLVHRYSFTTDASDSVGAANGTLVNTATVSGGSLQLNNPNFSGPSTAGGYLSMPASILPSSGSVTIESWFTFTGSGFFTEDWTFSNNANDTNPPGANNGQYFMHTISAPQGGPNPAGGGSHVAQALAGYAGGEIDAFGTTVGLGAGGGGYLDDGGTYFSATVIDGTAGTLSYYVMRVSDGLGGLQDTVAAIPLSSYSFTNAYLGRSAFAGDNSTSGSVDEFRIYNNAASASDIAADFAAGPNVVVPEPGSLLITGIGTLCLMSRRRGR